MEADRETADLASSDAHRAAALNQSGSAPSSTTNLRKIGGIITAKQKAQFLSVDLKNRVKASDKNAVYGAPSAPTAGTLFRNEAPLPTDNDGDVDSREVALVELEKVNTPGGSLSKRLADILMSATGLIATAPLLFLVFLLVRLDGGAAIFSQPRIGKDGRIFRCYKFRTMRPDAEDVLESLLNKDPASRIEWDTTRKLRNDPRITALGAFLRRKSLDELPQLWNVFKGDMSMVGPRPILVDEMPLYGDKSDHYRSCKPGLTGAWQVSGRNNLPYDERVRLDVNYVQTWNHRVDFQILLRTFRVVLNEDGAV